MSHFTVAVFSDGTKTVRELLAPYQENNMGDCPKEYLKFNSVTEEKRNEYENDVCERFVTTDGGFIYPWDDRFKVEITKEEYEDLKQTDLPVESTGFGKSTRYYKRDYSLLDGELKDVPLKEIYSTFEQYMDEYCGYKLDEEMNDYGYWENPNKKWDWWVIGGRWRGLLKAENGEYGEESLIIPKPARKGRYDSAKVKDIDFSPDKKKYEKFIRFWEVVVEDSPLRPGENKEDFAYHYKKEWYLKHYKTKEQYAERNTIFTTYAVVMPDGTWYEKGKMGWWGVSSETHEEAYDWDMHYKENFIDKADPEWTLTIVDCHI